MTLKSKPCDAHDCHGSAQFVNSCGAWVCSCGKHVGLCKCFCGWSQSGGDGRRELIDDGETIDEDVW